MNGIVMGVMSLQSRNTGEPSGIDMYSWYVNGTDGECVSRFMDVETGTWCSEVMTATEAFTALLADGRTITPGMGRDLTLYDLDDESDMIEDINGGSCAIDFLDEIVKNHHVTCGCEPCKRWDAR
jgi:hypothetical protein